LIRTRIVISVAGKIIVRQYSSVVPINLIYISLKESVINCYQ
jgi:hypothetical protein